MTPFWNTLILLTFVLEVVHVFGIPGEAKTYAQSGEFVRTRQLARQDTDPTVDPFRTVLMIGENATVSDSFLLNYRRDKSPPDRRWRCLCATVHRGPSIDHPHRDQPVRA